MQDIEDSNNTVFLLLSFLPRMSFLRKQESIALFFLDSRLRRNDNGMTSPLKIT